MLTKQLLDLAYFGIAIAAAVDGLDRHISCIPLPTLMSGLRNLFFSQLLLFVAIFAVKLSITLFVLKIGGLSKVFRTALVVNITFLGLANAAFIIELLLQCRPIQGNWNPDVRATANCVSAMGVMVLCYTSAIVSVITDFCCVFLPLPMIWNLQMSRRTKQSIIALLLMGTAAMICGIVRITQVSSPDDMDFTCKYGTGLWYVRSKAALQGHLFPSACPPRLSSTLESSRARSQPAVRSSSGFSLNIATDRLRLQRTHWMGIGVAPAAFTSYKDYRG